MKTIEIPKGFIKSGFQLTMLNWKNLEIVEKHILRMLWRDYELYYRKEKIRNTDLTTVTFYSTTKHEIVNSEHSVPKDFLKEICLRRK